MVWQVMMVVMDEAMLMMVMMMVVVLMLLLLMVVTMMMMIKWRRACGSARRLGHVRASSWRDDLRRGHHAH